MIALILSGALGCVRGPFRRREPLSSLALGLVREWPGPSRRKRERGSAFPAAFSYQMFARRAPARGMRHGFVIVQFYGDIVHLQMCFALERVSMCAQQYGMLSRFSRQDRVSTAHGRPVQQYRRIWSSRHLLTERIRPGDLGDLHAHRWMWSPAAECSTAPSSLTFHPSRLACET
jgi:hypothetical protein